MAKFDMNYHTEMKAAEAGDPEAAAEAERLKNGK